MKKRISVKEFARALVLLHGSAFAPTKLDEELKAAKISLADQEQANAGWEWFIFGEFVIVQTVSTALKGRVEWRDRVLNLFTVGLYDGLVAAGFKEAELPALERDARERFREYFVAWEDGGAPESIVRLAVAFGRNLLGSTYSTKSGNTFISAKVIAHMTACAGFIRRMFDGGELVA